MKRILLFSILTLLFSILVFSQTPQKTILMSGVFLESTWPDSIQTGVFYNFQLKGNKGRIANIKVRLKYGELQQLKDNNYKAKVNVNDNAMILMFNKYDPMSKKKKVLKEIVVPVKK